MASLIVNSSSFTFSCPVDDVELLPGRNFPGDVPHPVPDPTDDNNAGLRPHLLPPLGLRAHRSRHPAAAAAEAGQQEADN